MIGFDAAAKKQTAPPVIRPGHASGRHNRTQKLAKMSHQLHIDDVVEHFARRHRQQDDRSNEEAPDAVTTHKTGRAAKDEERQGSHECGTGHRYGKCGIGNRHVPDALEHEPRQQLDVSVICLNEVRRAGRGHCVSVEQCTVFGPDRVGRFDSRLAQQRHDGQHDECERIQKRGETSTTSCHRGHREERGEDDT
jgi:hypothetical protein